MLKHVKLGQRAWEEQEDEEEETHFAWILVTGRFCIGISQGSGAPPPPQIFFFYHLSRCLGKV